MLSQFFQRMQSFTRKSMDRRTRASQRRSRLLESLEERRLLTNVLTSYVWTGALGNDWGNPGNWDANNGTVPDDAGDTAIINVTTNSPALDQARTIGGMTGNGQLNLQSFALTVEASSSSSFSGSISGTGGLVKQGSSDFTLAATNTFTGSIEVNAGTLIAQNTATYRYFRFVPTKFYSASPAAFQLSEFQLTLNGVTRTGATVTNPGGTGNGSAVQDGSLLNGLTDSNKAPLVWDFGTSTAIDQYRWATANTTDTSGFPIRWRFEGSDDGSTWQVLDDKTSSDYATPTTAQAFLPSFDVANVLPDAAAVTVSGGTLVIGPGTEKLGSLAGGGNVVIGDGGLNLTGNASTSFGGVISGTGGVTKNGTGVWTLSGANTYSGHTTLNAGTIRLDANEVIPDGAGKGNLQINTGTSLDLHGFSETVNALTGVGTIDCSVAGNSTISIGNNNQSSSFAGVIRNTAGTVGLSKVGTGTVTISALNAYSGPTNIYQGTLQIAGVVPTYRYFRFSPTQLRNSPSAANSVQLSELQVSLGGVLLTGVTATNPGGSSPTGEFPPQAVDNNTATKWLDFNRGSLVLDFGTSRSFDQYRWATANDAIERDAVRWKFEGSANGTTWVMLDDKTAADYSTPTSRFTYLPYFNISGPPVGTAIPDNSPVFIAANANLNLNNASETIGELSGAGNVQLGAGALTVNSNSNSTFSGQITGTDNAGLTKSGPATLTISNANSFPGGATINSGTLEVTNTSGSALGTGNVTVNSGGTFAGTGSISGTVTVNNGGIVAPGTSGPGTLTVGAATFSPGATLDVNLNGTGAGQFDQLVVSTGAVTLGSVGLKPTLGYAASNGDTYRILDKLSAGAGAGVVSNVVNSTSAFDVNQTGGSGNDLVLTYLSGAPTVVSMNDSDADNTVQINEAITYTLTFSQDINHTTVSSADFNNAGTAVITLGTITEIVPGIFTMVVTPTSTGTIILQIPTGATILDNAGNAVVSPVNDNDTITVQAPPPIGWTFSSASNNTISGYTLGSQFSTSATFFISALGMYAPSGLSGSYSVGGGTLLVQTTVAPTDTLINQFRYHDLSAPLELSAGTYVVGAYYGSTAFYGSSPINFQTLPGVSFAGARYASSSGLSFPTTLDTGTTGYFGANFLVAPVTLASVSPGSAVTGGGSFTLTVTGTGFQNDSVVQWNGTSLATTYVNGNRLEAVVPAGNLATSYGSAQITVLNPTSNSGTSNARAFYLNTPGATAPTVTSPTSGSITSSAATLGGTVAGENGSLIQKRGVLYARTSVNPNPTLGGVGVIRLDHAVAATGTFTVDVSGLDSGASYSFVAFATNDIGTAYTGPVTTFTTIAAPSIGWTFSSATNSTISGYTLGSQFSTSVSIMISALGMYAPSGLSGSYSVGLWNTGGTLLAQTTVAPTDTLINQFRYHDLSTPLNLSAGTYVVGAYYGSTAFYGYSPSNFQTLPGVSFAGSRFTPSGALAFPTTLDTGTVGYFGANFLTTAAVSNSAPTNISLSSSSVAENLPSGTSVGTLSTTDPDSGNTFTYSLVTGSGSTDNASFTIDSGTLKTAAMFNFEAKNSYSIRVRSTDQGGLSYEKVLTITVTNVNETPTDISLSNSSVAENLAIGTTLGTFSTTDPDSGNTFTYSLVTGDGSTDNASFTIESGTLKSAAMFNFEAKNSYSIRVRSTDQGGLSYEKALTISVTNVNETPTDISLSSSSVAENLAVGTSVGTFSTTDPDSGNTFTYSLVAGDGSTDNASFTIDSGTLKTAEVFNFETKSSYSIRVRSTDQDGLSIEKNLTISVSDVAEDTTAPTATVRPLPLTTSISTVALTIDVNDPAGAVGDPVSGVASYDVYVAVDSGGWSLFADDVPATQSTVNFTASSNHRYWFRAVAKDNAGNVEVEPATPLSEANTFVTDFEAPVTAVVSATADSNGLFTLNLQGSDVGGSTISRFRVFVKVDDGAAVEIPQTNAAAGTPNGSGVQSATTNYQASRDGVAHSYTFFTRAIDTAGNLEAAPTDASADVRQTHTFAPPVALAATGIDVQNGATQRSYIRNVDVLFNDVNGLQTLIDNNRFHVEKFALDDTTPDQGTGTAITGFGGVVNSNAVRLDFGTNGIGGLGNSGNGFYRIAIDVDGDGDFDDAHFEFFRLWTGPVR